jgi:hypothetical protein
MSIRVLIYAREGDGAAQAGMNQLRAIISELRIDASVMMVTDPMMHANNGVTEPPAFVVDGVFVSNGWVPARNEILRALNQRLAAIKVHETPAGFQGGPGGKPGAGGPPRRH